MTTEEQSKKIRIIIEQFQLFTFICFNTWDEEKDRKRAAHSAWVQRSPKRNSFAFRRYVSILECDFKYINLEKSFSTHWPLAVRTNTKRSNSNFEHSVSKTFQRVCECASVKNIGIGVKCIKYHFAIEMYTKCVVLEAAT